MLTPGPPREPPNEQRYLYPVDGPGDGQSLGAAPKKYLPRRRNLWVSDSQLNASALGWI
jgi:hypothetical protein